ncbi:hypothetical protein [Geodermatophilus sp. SYSU D01176]
MDLVPAAALDALLRGGLGAAGFVLLFLAARRWWKEQDSSDAQADVGLD